MQPTVDIGDVLNRAFDVYKKNLATLLLVHLLAFVIGAATVGLLAGPMMAGVAMVVLAFVDRKEPAPSIGDLFQGFTFFVPALIFAILYFVASIVGQTVLTLLPVIGFPLSIAFNAALSTAVMFAMFNIVDRKMDITAAITASVDMVKDNFWIFLGLNVVAGVIGSLGAFACGIGIVVTIPMYSCMVAIAYRDALRLGVPA